MEAIVFQTQNENYYLYSPLKKAILPLSKNMYDIISNDRNEGDETFRQLKQYGYLDKYTSSFDSYITGNTIQGVLVKLSQIIFETTTLCNLRCEYCCYSEGYDTFDSRRGMLGNLKFETAKGIIDYLAILFQKEPLSNAPKEPFAISFYGGEPLMNFAVVRQIVEYAERIEFRNRSLFFTMTTNAMLLSKYADFLSRHKFKMLISLDGNKENDSYRVTPKGNPSFDIVMMNLKCVENLYSEWFATFRYNAVFTNKSDVREIVDWFKMQFNTTPNFSPLHVPTEDAKDGNRILSMLKTFEIPENIELVPSLITQNPLFNRILVFTTRLLNNSVSKESELLVDESIENSTLPTGTCIPFSKRLFVSYNGKIHPCEKVNRDSPLGYIDNSGCVHIDCNEVANGFMKRITEVSSLCKKCYMQFCCTKCSFCYSNGKCDEFTSHIECILPNRRHLAKELYRLETGSRKGMHFNLFHGHRKRDILQLVTTNERTDLNRFYPIGNIYLFEKTTIIKSESSDIIYRTGNRDRLEFVTTFKSIVTDFNHFFLFAVPFYFRWNFDFARIFLVAVGHDSVAVNVITVVDAIHLKVVGITCHGNYGQ